MSAMLWIKTLHILGVMAWMAGIFYLPRIFVHYVEGRAYLRNICMAFDARLIRKAPATQLFSSTV